MEDEKNNNKKPLTIRIPKKLYKVEEVSYDEDGENFLLTITLKNGEIEPAVLFNLSLQETDEKESLQFNQLFGRALARLKEDKELDANWCFISKDDIEKTIKQVGTDEVFLKIFKKLGHTAPMRSILILLWQDNEGVKAVIKAGGKEMQTNIQESLKAQMRENCVFTGPFQNFTQAELKIRNAIKSFFGKNS
jgi:hypothetical protein